jgi:asparagine synthase (glutamine-hydrolysing)
MSTGASMCGIVGTYSSGPLPDHDLRLNRALKTLQRRGPDDHGLETLNGASGILSLGHTRLSIIDISSGGHQPMYSQGGRLALVFNGEIYNYQELRSELQQRGVMFRTQSDTEVLLHAWANWGDLCLPRLIGMFAFALFDRETETLTCVRDPFGIKPFFYSWDQATFLFASELPAIKALRSTGPALNLQRAYDYLVLGDYDNTEQSFLRDVFHLMPGHLLRVRMGHGEAQPMRWWQPRVVPVQALSFEDAAVALREKLLESVRLHLRCDVALGAALSGGLDSSTIVCAMRHVEPDLPIHTFSYVARGSAVSEEHWVDRINAHVGAIGHKVEVAPKDLVADLEDMIVAQGEPFGSTSIYAQYRVYKLARDHGVTVTLDGQGADELLAGYRGYPGQRVHSLLDERHYGNAWSFLRDWSRWPNRKFRAGLRAAAAATMDGPIYNVLFRLIGPRLRPAWLDVEALHDEGVRLSFVRERSPYDQPGRRLVSELAHCVTRRGLPALLRHGDRNSMRFSVESRVPFLTAGLADFLLTLPEDYLISPKGETKRILRVAMRGIVPDDVLDRRDKIGLFTPEKTWLQQIAPQVRDWLEADLGLAFLHRDAMLNEFDAMLAGTVPFSWQTWRWINFTRWYKWFFSN